MRNQKLQIIALVIAIVGLGIGFAAFSNTLTISESATVTPDSSNFKVVFTKTSGTEDASPIVPTKRPTTITATNGTIDATNKLTLTNLGATFTEPGQSVEYNLYVYNAGAYIAHLNSITYRGTKSCTPNDNTVNYVDEACNAISMKVKIGNTEYSGTTQDITGQSLNPGASTPVKVTIEYASNGARADGAFRVSFPDVSLYYMTVSGTNENYVQRYTLVTDSNICNGDRAFKIGDEYFCIMSENSTSITGLSQKLLSLDLTNPRQTDTFSGIRFSSTEYWFDWNEDEFLSEYTGTNPYVYNSQSNLYPYVEAYKEYLESLGAIITDARLLSYEEANSLISNSKEWIKLTNIYWLGSASFDRAEVETNVWGVYKGRLSDISGTANTNGIRPLIIISKS